MRRKLKEIILSLKIEKRYSKEQILTLYCNQFYLGHGLYGVEAVSQKFFGKSVTEVNLVEAALITGIFRGPSIYSPYNNPKLMLKRRNHVLNRMYEEGYISKDVSESAQKEPVSVLPRNVFTSDFAAYFIEEVRKYIIENYGSSRRPGSGEEKSHCQSA
jgi:penicillin-binding protein 1A